MKIAVCLSGHMRKFQETLQPFNAHFLSKYDCDVFIHTWDRMGYGSAYKTDQTLDSTHNHLSTIERLYKPKKLIVEDSSFVNELKAQGNLYAPHLINEPKHVGHMASMFYKIFACNEIRKQYEIESGTQYDWVVRSRTDLMFHAPVHLPVDKTPGRIYVPQSRPDWVNDQFAVGQSNEMDLYSSFFFHMEEYFLARNEFYPEKFMVWSLAKKNLQFQPIDVHYHILR